MIFPFLFRYYSEHTSLVIISS